MCRLPEHVQAAVNECIKLNAIIDQIHVAPSNKYVGIIHFNNKTRKFFMSKTPSDFRASYKVAKDVRRAIREMSLG